MNRRESDRVFAQGCKAAENGVDKQANPYPRGVGLNWFHWNAGYDSYHIENDLVMPSSEVAHIVQWVELSMRAQNFGLQVRFNAEGFTLHHRQRSPAAEYWVGGGQIGEVFPTLFDLRTGISDYVAGERSRGRKI